MIEIMNQQSLQRFFRRNMKGSIDDPELLDYVVSVLMRSVADYDAEFISGHKPLSVVFDELWRNPDRHKAYEGFRNSGDTLMWICGFFPQNLSRSRKSRLGLGWYVGKGKYSYDSALYLANVCRINDPPIQTISKAGSGFERCSAAIIEMRARANACNADLPPELAREISDVLYHGEDVVARLMDVAGKERPSLYLLQ